MLWGGLWVFGAQVSSMFASGPGGGALSPNTHYQTRTRRNLMNTSTLTHMCRCKYPQTHYLRLLLPLKISCTISTVCCSVTLSLLFMHMLVAAVSLFLVLNQILSVLSLSIPLLLFYFSFRLLLLTFSLTSLSFFFSPFLSPSPVPCGCNNPK